MPALNPQSVQGSSGMNTSTNRFNLGKKRSASSRVWLVIFCLALVAACALPLRAQPGDSLAPDTNAAGNHPGVRQDPRLDSGWLFQQGDVAGAENPGFDTAGWYRRQLEVAPAKGKRYCLRFEAASPVADVYLNGQFLGEPRGGFGAFCFEITTHLSASGNILLAVRVSKGQALEESWVWKLN